ncbi:MAG: PAS domain-containing protein [Thermoanaerobaculia bacterium]|nr:PAS domain-containing protein [Thermoanaerobaculia bacterium]
MRDMTAADVQAPAREHNLRYHDGTSRRVFVTEVETPFPAGELIVSQTDPAGIITMCNDAFVLMSGYSREELLGTPHHILRHPDMPAVAFKGLWETIEKGIKWHGYVKNLRRDGGFYWVYATVVGNVRNGKLVGYSSVRREPSRTKVIELAAVYAGLLAEER